MRDLPLNRLLSVARRLERLGRPIPIDIQTALLAAGVDLSINFNPKHTDIKE